MYELAWRDDREITWDDWPELVGGTVAMGVLWAPEILTIAGASTTPLVVVEVAVVVGAIASYGIGGVEGVENYIDFITEPSKIPERVVFTAETIYEHKIEEPLVASAEAYVGWVDRRATEYVGWVDRRIDDFKLTWSITKPQSLW
jgi:hypothetical protein